MSKEIHYITQMNIWVIQSDFVHLTVVGSIVRKAGLT